jgi:hypothetical protein
MHSVILKNKRPITINDVKLLDLQERSVNYSLYKQPRPLVIATIEITDIAEMRLDILSEYYYKNPNYGEFILKFNGISNPFSIEVGDILYIPELISFTGVLVDNSNINEDNRLLSVNGKNLNPILNQFKDKFSKNLNKSI